VPFCACLLAAVPSTRARFPKPSEMGVLDGMGNPRRVYGMCDSCRHLAEVLLALVEERPRSNPASPRLCAGTLPDRRRDCQSLRTKRPSSTLNWMRYAMTSYL